MVAEDSGPLSPSWDVGINIDYNVDNNTATFGEGRPENTNALASPEILTTASHQPNIVR